MGRIDGDTRDPDVRTCGDGERRRWERRRRWGGEATVAVGDEAADLCEAPAATESSKAAAVAGTAAGTKMAMAVVVDGGTLYTKAESVAIARAWDSVTTDAIVGTDQTDICFWKRVLAVYNEFKPPGSAECTHDKVRKKFGRITTALKRIIGIYENQMRTAESGRSEADIKALSMQLYNTEGNPKFAYCEEFFVLRDSAKFRAICGEENAPGTKRTRLGRADNYSSSSGSRPSTSTAMFWRSPPRHSPDAHVHRGSSPHSKMLDPPPNTLLRAHMHPALDWPKWR